MKKVINKQTLLATLAGAALLAALPGLASAAVTGTCVSCHTMHNSEAGGTVSASGPHGVLLNSDCAGCHTAGTGSTVKTDVVTGAPLVLGDTDRTFAGNTMMPGGFFNTSYIGDAAQKKMHNVDTASLLANTRFTYPPGGDSGWILATNPLSCAGTYGCHGDRTVGDPNQSIAGKHHNDTLAGFRMLNGIRGLKSPNYNIINNIYAASHNNAGTDTWTMSALCGQCHGDYHSTAVGDTKNAAGAWIRHPTDFKLSAATQTYDDYDGYGLAGNAYDQEVPIGFAVTQTAVNTGDAVTWATYAGDGSGQANVMVMCTSCHFAHGGAHDSILRWSYSTMDAGTTGAAAGTGCFRCHTGKDGV